MVATEKPALITILYAYGLRDLPRLVMFLLRRSYFSVGTEILGDRPTQQSRHRGDRPQPEWTRRHRLQHQALTHRHRDDNHTWCLLRLQRPLPHLPLPHREPDVARPPPHPQHPRTPQHHHGGHRHPSLSACHPAVAVE